MWPEQPNETGLTDVRVGLSGLLLASITGLATWGCGGAGPRAGNRDLAVGYRSVMPVEAQDRSAAGEPAERGALVRIRVGGIEVEVEIADEPAEHRQGLMLRESLPEDQGMLFVYPRERTLGFWMKDTLIPLDIAYADHEGRIVDIFQMAPMSLETLYSTAPAMFALEMNQGWFERHGVEVGDRIEYDGAGAR